jgi:hypothetical protein
MARRRGAQQRADDARPNECFHGLAPQNRRKTKTAVALFDAVAVRFPLKLAGSSVPGRCWMPNMAAATGRRILKIDEASASWIAAREKVGAGFSEKSAPNQGNLEPSAIRPNCRRP